VSLHARSDGLVHTNQCNTTKRFCRALDLAAPYRVASEQDAGVHEVIDACLGQKSSTNVVALCRSSCGHASGGMNHGG